MRLTPITNTNTKYMSVRNTPKCKFCGNTDIKYGDVVCNKCGGSIKENGKSILPK
jgi:transcription initiation factor TFIIIB Brf1 subunit/transcription initiation factor TFIIB